MAENKLYDDENLDVLSWYVKDESVDLVLCLAKIMSGLKSTAFRATLTTRSTSATAMLQQ